MRHHPKETRNAWRRSFLATTAVVVLAVSVVANALTSPRLWAQASAAPAAKPQSLEAMEAAGVKMSFDVASVKQNKSVEPRHTNVPLNGACDSPPPAGGLFSATNMPLINYILFAYDLGQAELIKLMPQLPPWAKSSRFDIQARAQGNPTCNQLRLMMQSLLEDRFKLALHTETKQGPIYALVLTKPGKLGPHLQQHTDDSSCSTGQLSYDAGTVVPGRPSRTSVVDLPPLPCGVMSRLTPSVPGLIRFGGRGISLTAFINYTSEDRPEIDRTGLSGTFDFDCEIAVPSNGPSNSQPESAGETFREAIQDQLGLKLESQTGPVTTFVLDHIEEPSPN
jgi:uncharacterized protein (TIGR03435 family)